MKKCSGHGRCCRPSSYATAYAHAGKISKERSRLLKKISGIRLNFVITETFKKLPPPPPPPPTHTHTHTDTKGVLSRCACVTYGRKCARTLCVCGGGAGGRQFHDRGGIEYEWGGAAAPPKAMLDPPLTKTRGNLLFSPLLLREEVSI